MPLNQNIANTLWNILDILVYPLLFFISAPYFLSHLGTAAFGIWMLVTSITVSMQVFNLGIGTAVLKNTALYIGQKDPRSGIGVINSALSFTLLLFVICLCLGWLGYYLVEYRALFKIEQAYRLMCAKSFLVAGVLVGLKFFEQIFVNYFKALELFKVATLLGSGNRLTALLINLILLHYSSLTIVQILLVTGLVNMCFCLLGRLLQRRTLAGGKFTFQFKMPRHESSFALLIWLQSICIIFTFQSDRYLVVSYFGLAALSYYALTATMFNHLHMGLNALLPWLSPKFTKMHARRHSGVPTYKAASSMVGALSVLLLLVFSVSFPYLFGWICGEQMATAIDGYVRYFIAFESFFALTIIPAYYLNAVGLHRTYFYYVLSFSGLAILAMFSFIHLISSPVSVIYGLITAGFLGTLLLLLLTEKIISGRRSFTAIGSQLAPSVLLCFLLFTGSILIKVILAMAILILLYYAQVRGRRSAYLSLIKL